MSTLGKSPMDFWDREEVTPVAVLGDILNEIRQQTQIIKGYSEVLLKTDLPVESRDDLEVILERSKYIESILDAGRQYYINKVDKTSVD